ncbi:Pc20g15190 protein [Mycena kentingensis (nom. inval.)]|nr:Pc20g15190 protein [Mycena kentingensis (nom. inval.)]
MSTTASTTTPSNAPHFPPADVIQSLQKPILPSEWRCISMASPAKYTVSEALEKLEKCLPVGSRLKILLADTTRIEIAVYEPTLAQASAAAELYDQMRDVIRLAPGAPLISLGLRSIGTTTFGDRTTGPKKQPDSGFMPSTRVPGEWPTVVMEVGLSESRPELYQDVQRWFRISDGSVNQVKLVISVKLFETTPTLAKRMEVTFYERAAAPQCAQILPGTHTYTWTQAQPPSVPISIPVLHMYDLAPVWLPNPIVLSTAQLQYWMDMVFQALP